MNERVRRVLVAARAAVLVMFGIATLGITAMGATPAQASTSCYGYSCHGHDPVTYGCSTTNSSPPAYVVDSSGTTLATVWDDWSYGCKANWANAVLSPAAINAGDVLFVEIKTKDSQNQNEWMCYPGLENDSGKLTEGCAYGAYPGEPGIGYGGSAGAYTDMVDGTNKTYADVTVYAPYWLGGYQIGQTAHDQGW